MHLLRVIEVELLAHVCGAGIALAAQVQRVPESMFVAANPLKRGGRDVVDLLVEQGVVPGGPTVRNTPGWPARLSGEAAALWYQSRPCAMSPARKSVKLSSEQPPAMR
jgi:hypothetical protein